METKRPLWPLLAALLVAGPATAQVALHVPDEVRLSEGTYLAGLVELPGAILVDPVVTDPHTASFAGTLLVCPTDGEPGGVVRPVVLDTLASVRPDCPSGVRFQDPQVAFGGGTRLAFGGNLTIQQMPGASLLAPFGASTVTLAMTLGAGRQPMVLAPDAGEARFAPLSGVSSIAVQEGDGKPAYFNGTAYAYIVQSDAIGLDASALASVLGGPFRATVRPALHDDIAQALADPFAILDAQDALLGPDAREPRGNVSRVLQEFGRVPSYVNSALLGRLNGTIDGRAFHGEVVLVRAPSFTLAMSGGTLAGTGEPRVSLGPDWAAFKDGDRQQAPWTWFAILWAVAILVLVVRRRDPDRKRWSRPAWGVAFVASLLLFDAFVLHGDLGAGAVSETREGSGIAPILALAAFGLVVATASYLALGLPGRLLLGRVVPQRFVWIGELAWAAAWAVLPLLFPAAFFAMGYDLARI